MPNLAIQHAFNLALQHHQACRLPEAEQLYRQILAQEPDHADAIHLLGVISLQCGRAPIAVELIARSLAINPASPQAHANLGTALRACGKPDDAIAAFRKAIALSPAYADAHFNLGIALADQGNHHAAVEAYEQALALKPDWPQARNNLANVLKASGQLDAAIAAYRDAIAIAPLYAEAWNNLGNALLDQGQFDEAIAAYRRSIAANPGLIEAQNNLAGALREIGRLDEAIALCREVIARQPNFAPAFNTLGNSLKSAGQLDPAIAAYEHAVALDSKLFEARNNLAFAQFDTGQLDAAITTFRQALQLDPDNAAIDSNLVYAIQFHPAYDAAAIAEENRRWNRRHAEPLRRSMPPASIDFAPERRLRIGYISPDFRDHVVGRNLLPLFAHHDHMQFEIFCYSQVRRPDAITAQFQQFADHWQSIVGTSDEQVANQIRDNRIDILVDLTLHMANNRLLVFARKPAPVQVTFAGYPASTGLGAIDCRLSDPYLDPPGIDESIFSEKTIRLPNSFWCYEPLEDPPIPVSPLPAAKSGIFTFGCLNNFCKVNDVVLRLWAKVLSQIKNARLLLLAPEGSARQRTTDRLRLEMIDPDRIEFVSPQPREMYLKLYHRIDIGLDTFPYNGHTTSLDSFWMGVPVITLIGPRTVSRAGWSQLSNLSLPELAAQTPEQFVTIATKLATDLPPLEALRSTLRQRMRHSPLTSARSFAQSIESAYRQMWRKCCHNAQA